MRARRLVALGLATLALPALAVPILAAGGAPTSTSKIEAILADLDGSGNVAAVRTSGVLRVFADGSFSVDDGGVTQSGTAKGSKDLNFNRALTLDGGLVKTPNGLRALPVTVRTTYKLDGADIAAEQLAGKAGTVEVSISLTNRTLKTQNITYTDAASGKQVTATGVTAMPISVVLTGLQLPDANFDNIETNGIQSRSSDGTATALSWSAFLAPPLYPGTQNLTIKARTNGFKMTSPQIAMQLGGGDQPAQAVKDAQDKGGATAQTLRGYFNQFGTGFGQLNDGLGQIKTGVDGVQAGLNNAAFDRPAYDQDSTIPTNQPGVLEGLHLIDDGLAKLKTGIGAARAGLNVGSGSLAGALQQIEDGIGDAAHPDSLQGALVKIRVGLASGDPKNPAIIEGLQQILAGVGDATNPLTLIGGLTAIKAGLTSGDPAHPAILEGLQQIAGGVGSAGNPASLLGGLLAIKGGLSSGDQTKPAIVEGIQQILAGIGDGSNPATLLGGLLAVKAGLSSGNVNDPHILEGLQQIVAGIGDGTNQQTLLGGLLAIKVGLSSGNLAQPAILEGLQLMLAGIGTKTDNTAATLAGGLNGIRAGIGTGDEFDCSVPRDGIKDATVPAGQPLAGQPCDVTAALASPAQASPITAQASMELFRLGLGKLETFYTADASDAACAGQCVSALFDSPLFVGLAGAPLTASQKQTVMSFLNVPQKGLPPFIPAPVGPGGFDAFIAGIGNKTAFDCPPYNPISITGLQAAFTDDIAAGRYTTTQCNETTPGAVATSLESGFQQVYAGVGDGSAQRTLLGGLLALRAGIQSGDPSHPGVVEGVQQILAGLGNLQVSNSLIGGLAKVRAGLASGDPAHPAIVEGLQQILAGLGDASSPASLIGGLTAVRAGLSSGSPANPKILEGLQQIVAGLGTQTNPATVIGGLTAIKAGLSSGDPAKPAIIEGIQQIVSGVGSSGNAASLLGGLTAIKGGLSSGDNANPKIIEGLLQIFAGIGKGTEFDATGKPGSVAAGLAAVEVGIGTPSQFDCSSPPDKVPDAVVPAGRPLAGQPCDVNAALATPPEAIPLTVQAGLATVATGIGGLNADGTATKAVSTRQGKFGVIETATTALYGIQQVQDALKKFYDGFGARTVKGSSATLLNGLQQLSDGLQQTLAGTASGRDGAATLSGVVKSSVVKSDQEAAFQNAGIKRAANFPAFVSAPAGAATKVLFLYRLPAIG